VDKVLVIWRKLTDDPEQNAAVLETLLTQHLRINQRDTEFDAIYINGPHGLSTDFEGKYRLHSLEEAFHAAMWAQD
jgi:adenine-specific DNA-methyltransferase